MSSRSTNARAETNPQLRVEMESCGLDKRQYTLQISDSYNI